MTTQVEELNKVTNHKVSAASSSLTKLVVILDSGDGVELHAQGNPAIISIAIKPASELHEQTEAVCQVDWTWIVSSVVESISVRESTVVFHFKPAGDLTVDARLWQGSPFLSFMPWHPARK